jgi:hypothetical protein
MADHLESRLVVDALALAVERRLPGEGLLCSFLPPPSRKSFSPGAFRLGRAAQLC